MYTIKTEQFEGPLELLLSLIEKRRLDITRLSLSKITGEYLDYIAAGEGVSLEHMSSFLAVAAQLLLIKSKSLLPFLLLDEEEEEVVEDLEFRLREYKKFKDAALVIKMLYERPEQSHGRETVPAPRVPVFAPPKRVDTAALRQAFEAVLGSIPVFERLEEESLEEIVTLEEKILHLRDVFTRRTEGSFHEVVAEAENRMDVIVSFLALLELVKQRVLHADQSDLFVEIRVRRREE